MGIEVAAAEHQRGAGSRSGSPREGKIHFGLAAIKGVGIKAVEAIVKARAEGGPFTSLDDFFERVSADGGRPGCAETLIKAGAFDCLGGRSRAQLLAVLPRAIQAGQAKQEDRERGQRSLFDAVADAPGAERQRTRQRQATARGRCWACPTSPSCPMPSSWPRRRRRSASTCRATRWPATPRLLAGAGDATAWPTSPACREKVEVVLGGMIAGVQIRNVQKSRSGLTRMAKLTFEDLTGSTPAMLWPEEFAKMEALVKNDLIVFVRGTLDRTPRPRRAGHQPDHPARARDPPSLPQGVVVSAAQGGPSGRAPRTAAPRMSGSDPGNLDLYLEIMGLEQVRRAIYKAGASLAGPLRRPPDRRPRERRRPGHGAPARPWRRHRPDRHRRPRRPAPPTIRPRPDRCRPHRPGQTSTPTTSRRKTPTTDSRTD